MTARIFILARNIEPSPRYQDVKTYQLGSLAVAASNDPYRRHVYSAVVRMNNPAGRRDKP
jgi:type IV pilus assembly protein PilW